MKKILIYISAVFILGCTSKKFDTRHTNPETRKFIEMCNQLSENDNPVLLIAKMK
jgi:hypothetical protein